MKKILARAGRVAGLALVIAGLMNWAALFAPASGADWRKDQAVTATPGIATLADGPANGKTKATQRLCEQYDNLPLRFENVAPQEGAAYSGVLDGFLFKLGAPRIASVALSGKHLLVVGENFDQGAALLINGEPQKTENDAANTTTRLIGKKAAKRIPQGQAVKVQVRNTDGTMSNELTFTRVVD